MSEDFTARWADEEDLARLPSWAQYQLGYRTVVSAAAKEDVEKTLLVQLTYPELAVLPFALLIVSRLYPEMVGLAGRLSTKLNDLADAQEFLTGSNRDEG